MQPINKSNRAILICVSGGSGSGKTTVASLIDQNLPKSLKSIIICQDSYYLPFSDKTLEERKQLNFDHPSAFDWTLLSTQLKTLLSGHKIAVPIYDYETYTRTNKTFCIHPVDVVIFEGLTAFYHPEINKIAKLKIFVDTPSDERLMRRIERDNLERGRSVISIINQWRQTVRPMYRQFIERQKETADLIIPWYSINDVALQAITGAVKEFVKVTKHR